MGPVCNGSLANSSDCSALAELQAALALLDAIVANDTLIADWLALSRGRASSLFAGRGRGRGADGVPGLWWYTAGMCILSAALYTCVVAGLLRRQEGWAKGQLRLLVALAIVDTVCLYIIGVPGLPLARLVQSGKGTGQVSMLSLEFLLPRDSPLNQALCRLTLFATNSAAAFSNWSARPPHFPSTYRQGTCLPRSWLYLWAQRYCAVFHPFNKALHRSRRHMSCAWRGWRGWSLDVGWEWAGLAGLLGTVLLAESWTLWVEFDGERLGHGCAIAARLEEGGLRWVVLAEAVAAYFAPLALVTLANCRVLAHLFGLSAVGGSLREVEFGAAPC